MKKIALITASLALLAAPAFAEDAKTTGTAPAEAKFSTVSKDEMFSSKLKGLNVYNQKDESVGEIADIAIKNNQIDALILSVGGVLGVGQRASRRQERQMAGVDEHDQGSAEGRARVQIPEVSTKHFPFVRAAVGSHAGGCLRFAFRASPSKAFACPRAPGPDDGRGTDG